MRTVLIATGVAPDLAAVTADTAAPMLPLLGKPFIQHVVEILVSQGCLRLDVILHEHPDQVEALLGDGTRWGASFTYHVCRSGSDVHEKLALLARQDGEGLRLIFGDCLAACGYADAFACPPASEAGAAVRLAGHRKGPVIEPVWAVAPSGWFLEPASSVASTAERLVEAARSGGGLVEVQEPLRWRCCSDLLASARRAMEGDGPALLVTGRVTDERVWLGRNVALHPTAHLVPPVFIGPDCDVGAGVTLGPGAVVEEGCVLDRGCSVRNSVVLQSTYVGEGLELEDVVATARQIVNARYNAAVPIPDEYLLGSLKDGAFGDNAARAAGRLIGLLLLVALTPCWLVGGLLWLAGGLRYWPSRLACVRTPAPDNPLFWRPAHYFAMLGTPEGGGRRFFSRFLPGLVSVVRGELALVGVPPRTRQEVEALPPDWRQIYLRGRCGLIVEPGAIYSARRSSDEAFAADACFVANPSTAHKLALFSRYMFGALSASASRRAPEAGCSKGGLS